MGKLLQPKPAQWARHAESGTVENDAVLVLVSRLLACVAEGVEPTVVQLAALRMLQKSIILNYQRCTDAGATAETLKQATELAARYTIEGISDD